MTRPTQLAAVSASYDQTAAEISAGVTPTNYGYPPGDVRRYGADPTGSADSTAALATAASLLPNVKVVFPSGTYSYSVSPNWAVQNGQIEALGAVFLKYTGTGNAVTLDAGATGSAYNVQMGRFIVQSPTTAQNGVFVRGCHHGKFSFDVRGAGATYSGMLVNWCVLSYFEDYTCSVNEGAWYSGTAPANGLKLDANTVAGNSTASCTFMNAVIEGVTNGIVLVSSIGNVFVGGTSEANTYGVYNTSNLSVSNKFIGMDFEANSTADVYISGNKQELVACQSSGLVRVISPASNLLISGGFFNSIQIDSGAVSTCVTNCCFNMYGLGGTFTDNGTQTFISRVIDHTTGLFAKNVTVGILPSTGSITEVSSMVSGKFTTANGSTSMPTATATTIVTLPANLQATYLISAGVNSGTPAAYSIVSIVSTDQSAARITNLQTATNNFFTLSGLNVQCTQGSGITSTVLWSVIRIG